MDDDYVAQILAKEAKESSLKYSSQGLSALMPASRPASNAPKPNTRFLRNLIKVTDSHNTALKRKEEREARERMRQLKSQTSGTLASTSADRTSGGSNRRHERQRSRDRRDDREDRHRSHRRHRSRSSSTERDRTRRHRRDDDRVGEHRKRDRHSHRQDSCDRESSKKDRRERDRGHTRRRRDRSYSKSRSRSRSPRRDRSTDRRHSRREDRKSDRYTRSRSRSQERRRSRSSRHADPSPRRSRPEHTPQRDRASLPTQAPTEAEDSDPLEDLVGPLPPRKNESPIRSRGRGAYKPNLSNIDAHFAPGYDPTDDVHLEEPIHSTGEPSRRAVAGLMTKDDDWDMALEALRDRTRWKQKGEERLRAAGINEAAISQWKNNPAFTGANGEGKPEDVQWSKKGEGREWDRGKFVDDDGHIDIRAAW
ncbi:unnamed protein product [Penicillium salamii]|nr:unnamed protein product [Penicillium salamii]CAG8264594.1 unnamed protein product [Penicillium salamii]